jgi:hypothetical protein
MGVFMHKLLFLLVVLLVTNGLGSTVFAASNVNLLVDSTLGKVDGVKVNLKNRPLLINGVTYVSVRDIAILHNIDISWNPQGFITLTSENTIVDMGVNSSILTVNGEQVVLSFPVISQNAVVYAPLRGLASVLRLDLDYSDGHIWLYSVSDAVYSRNDVPSSSSSGVSSVTHSVYEKDKDLLEGYLYRYEKAGKVLGYSSDLKSARKEAIKRGYILINQDTATSVALKTVGMFQVYANADLLGEFKQYLDALSVAKKRGTRVEYYNTIVWKTTYDSSKLLNVQNILQMPSLPRGCEVTSLAIMSFWRSA